MIFLKISGGLGNQMFQYATATSLAVLKNTTTGVDLADINTKEGKKNFTYRNFQLDSIFNLSNFKIVPSYAYSFITGTSIIDKIKRKLIGGEYFLEKNLAFCSDIFKITKNTYLEGYFQSEKNFIKTEKEIRQQFAFTKKLNIKSEEILQKIQNSKSIAIHIRRGDYIKNKVINSVHGTCSISYYKRALKHFKIEESDVFFFSDDINWVKNNFTFLNPDKTHFIDWNTGNDSWQDMALMSNCQNFIIANSSFSWWGAWLSDYSDKKIIAPKKWFNDNSKNEQTKDLLPSSWIVV